ncbi:MAG TPA: YkvA family protein [bacterium]|nr:YkvA family protein [bacterium]
MPRKLKFIARDLKRDLQVYQWALKDPRTPRLAKILLGAAVGYAVLPLDLIPDFIPIIGHLDDAIIVPMMIRLALKMIPDEVIDECRLRVAPATTRHKKTLRRARRS